MANEFKVRVGVELNQDSFKRLKTFINGTDAGDVKVNLNTEDAQKKIKSLRTQIKNLGKVKVNLNLNVGSSGRGKGSSGVQNVVNGVNDAYNDLKNLAKRINSIRIQIAGLDSSKDSQLIDTLRSQLESLMATYNDTFRTFSKGFDMPKLNAVKKEINSVESELDDLWQKFAHAPKGTNTSNIEKDILSLEAKLQSLRTTYKTLGNGLTSNQIDNLTNSFGIASDKINVLTAKANDAKVALKAAFIADFNAGKFHQQLDGVTSRFNKLEVTSLEARNALSQYTAAHISLCAAIDKEDADIDEIIAANRQYEESLRRVTNQLKINESAQRTAAADNALAQSQQRLSNQIERWMLNNSAAMKQYGVQLQKLQVQLKNCDRTELNHIKSEFDEIRLAAEKAGLATQSMGDKIKSKMGEYAAYFSVASLAMEAVQAIKLMARTVLEVDTAMTGLYRVTDLTTSQYDELFNNMISSAKEYGATLKDIINATADWVRAGFDADTALGLAEVTTMYQHISDLDYDEAAENLLTSYNAYKDELLDNYGGDEVAAVEYITDVLNELDNKFSVTSAGLGEGLARSASALELAGNTYTEAAAMIGAVTEVTQDPEKAGSAMKILSLRLRGMKGQLQEMGEEVDENVESISKMQTQILNMTGGKVNIFDENGDFRSTYDIMVDIAEIYDDLSDTNQADLLETIAGKNRANDVASLISNMENAIAMNEAALDASGSAARENAKYVESLQGRIDALTASWQAFSTTVLESDFLKGLVSFANEFLDVITLVIDKIGTIPFLFGSIAGISSLMSGGKSGVFTNLINSQDYNKLGGLINNLQVMKVSVADLMAAFKSGNSTGGLKGFISGLSSMSNATKDVITRQDISNIQKYNNLIGQGVNPMTAWYQSMQSSSKAAKELVTQANGAQVSTKGLTAATNASRVAMIGAKAATIGLQVATVALQTALTLGITLAITAVISAINKFIHAEEELAEKVDEATASYKEQHDELTKNRSDFENLAQSYVKLSKGVEKFTGANKGLTTDEYKEYQSVVNQIADMVPSLVAGYDDQGNAILNCANNVGTLTQAYKDLIIAENNELLNGDGEDYEGISDISKDLKNSYDDLSTTGWFNDQLSIQGAEGLEELLKTAEITPDIVDDTFLHVEAVGKSLKRELEEQGLELEGMETPKWYSSRDTWNEFIAEACKQHPEVAKKLVDSMSSEMDSATQEMRTAISAHMENAFLRGNYSNIDSEMQNIASTVVGGLDSSFIAELNQSGGEDAVLDYVDGILGAINSLSKKEMDVLKNSFDLSSQFESGELNYGEYKAQLENAVKSIEAMGFDEEVVSQLKLSLNVDEVNEQYDALLNRLTSEEFGIKMDAEKAENFLRGLSSTELAIAMDIIPELDAGATVEEIESAINREVLIQGLNLDFNIGEEIEWIDAFNTALEESASATGLTSESIAALTSRYKDLEGFDAGKLFGKTAQGVKLNTDAVNELEAALEEQNKTALNTHMEELQAEYERLTVAIQDADSASERADLYTQRDSIVDQINDTATLISQYEGLTSAFNDWINAQAGADKGDSYSQAKTMMEDAEELRDSGHVGTNEFKAAAQFVSSEDLSTANIETIVDAWVEGKKKFDKYFTDDESGSNAFLKDLEAMGEGWAEFNEETQEWTLDVDIDEAAERLGVSTSFIMTMLDELEARGIKVNYEDEGLEEFKTHAEEAQEAYNKIMGENGEKKLEFKFGSGDIDTVNSQLDEAKLLYDTITTADGKVNLDAEGAEEVRTMILSLIEEKQQLEAPAVMSVKVEGEAAKTEIGKATTLVQQLQQNLWSLEQSEYNPDINVGDVQSKISTIISSLNTLEQQDPEIYTKLGLESGQVDSLKTAIGNIQANIDAGVEPSPEDIATVQSTISGIDATVVANVLLGDTSGTTGSATITPEPSTTDLGDGFTGNATITPSPSTFNLGNDFTGNATITPSPSTTDLGSNFTGSGTINLTPNPTSLSVTVTGVSKADGTAHVNGTAFANGTVGRAFKQGDWSIKGSGIALGGELGQELVVRDGRYFTIGDNGAEFFNYKSGDIIFNAGQTKQLFEQGKITRGATRGRALASGTAFVGGSIPSSGRAFHITTVDPDAEGGGKLYGGSTSNSSSSKKSSKSGDAADEFEETLDWIEIAIDRIERAISRLDLTANSIYKKWSTRNEALADEIGKVNEEINLQQAAYNRYMQEAKSVGLSSSWAKKVQDGKVDIETITDEDLANKIKEYQEWYEKALDCKDAIEELKEKEAELYMQRFENVAKEYEGMLSIIEYEKNMLDEYINQSEARGWIVSTKYYDALAENERENIAKLQEEKQALLSSMQEAMASGAIEKESEAWYDMVNQIDEVTLAIAEGETALLEYIQAIREIEWEVFDLLQGRISSLASEADFLIELLSSDKLYDDKGQFTNEGMSTMGLHGVNYNVYMAQADKYAKELLDINKELAKDPYNQELVDRRQELLDLQQESILAAEDEKNAIRDMVEEGIELELDALQERIDKYNEALEAQKDMYDYQKKVAEQTKEIASLEKQMAAYAGDDSEEAKAKIQELKVSLEEAKADLEETEYDRYISDQEQLLDSLYEEYETILNQRLDNIDALMVDMIDAINNNADTISTTLNDNAESVGYDMTGYMDSIWDTSGNIKDVTSVYGDDTATTVGEAIKKMDEDIEKMVDAIDKQAAANISYASSSSAAYAPQASAPEKTPEEPVSDLPIVDDAPKKDTSIKVGDTINAGNAKIYADSEGHGGGKQYFADNPVYTVVGQRGDYVLVSHPDGDSGATGWFKKSDVIKEYASGKRSFWDDEIAWTQENGREFIVRPSDGAILTPLAKGDSVLSATASQNIWDMANNPADFIRENLNLGTVDFNNNSGTQTIYTQNLDNVVFSFPNVRNYEELLNSLRKDRNFERLLKAMTFDQMVGRSSLAKGKSIR